MAGRGFRADIQGLRAFAVMLVVVYHLWPHRLSGGFVGVDVFFVISGFLITRHLAEEVEREGRVHLLRFWSRRARRLLPAAFLVLLISLAMAWAWLPQPMWEDTVRQVRASAFYVVNWLLAGDAVDYSAMNADATVAQHYWSLAVEEQFYLVWPVLMAALFLLSGASSPFLRRARLSSRGVLGLGLSLVAVVSFVYSVLATRDDQSVAYFVTTARVWEFAVGGLLGLAWTRRLVGDRLASPLAWFGLAAIAVAAIGFDASTAFPGFLALLPVLGTAMVLAGGATPGRLAPHAVLSCRPAAFFGDISYSLYLWHWPLIVVAPYALDRPVDRWAAIMILATAIVLSWVTTRFVENPARTGWPLQATPASLGFAATGMVVLVLAGSGLLRLLPDDDRPVVIPTSTTSCDGPGALDPANGCRSVLGERPPSPGSVEVARQNKEQAYPGCQAEAPGTELVSCDLGTTPDLANRQVAVVGDSHATSWFPALDRIGEMRGWSVRTFTKSGCPFTRALRVIPGETATDNQRDCLAWAQRVEQTLAAEPNLAAVFTASRSSAYEFVAPPGGDMDHPSVDGFTDAWDRLLDRGLDVFVFEEVPRTRGGYVPTCLAEHEDPLDCSVPVARALPEDLAISSAARSRDQQGVRLIELRDQFCDDRRCYPVVGSLIVYRDDSHLTWEYTEALVPFVDRQLPR